MAIWVPASTAMPAVGKEIPAVRTPRSAFSSASTLPRVFSIAPTLRHRAICNAATPRQAPLISSSLFDDDLKMAAFMASIIDNDFMKKPLSLSHCRFTLSINSSSNTQMYQASKAYLDAKTQSQGIKPVVITGEELSGILIEGEKPNWLFLSRDGSDSAWYEYNVANLPGVPMEKFCELCYELADPVLREQLLGCSHLSSIVNHAAGGLERAMLEHNFTSFAKDKMMQRGLIYFKELDDEFEGTQFKWRIHSGGSRLELSFKINKDDAVWKKVMQVYLPHIMQHYRETSLA